MQIPEFWAEVRVEGKVGDKKRVVRRFGWSDDSQEQAEAHARERADAAFAELRAGNVVPNREKKLMYGNEGLPIREEVVARNGIDVITRNSYGARCLNEPDVFFADIDLAPWPLPRPLAILQAALTVLGVAAILGGLGMAYASFADREICSAIAYFVGGTLVASVVRMPLEILADSSWNEQRVRAKAVARVREQLLRLEHVRAALYDSPAGLRILLLHRTFEAQDEATQRLFRELGTDPAYAQMCALQHCFRARVSAKPWRIGLRALQYPRSGRWPITAERLQLRKAWVAEYEPLAAGYAACHFLHEVGTAPLHPRCATVQRMHDELCRARTDLPLA